MTEMVFSICLAVFWIWIGTIGWDSVGTVYVVAAFNCALHYAINAGYCMVKIAEGKS